MQGNDINPEVLRLAIGTADRAEQARDCAEDAMEWALELLETLTGTSDYEEARALLYRHDQRQAGDDDEH